MCFTHRSHLVPALRRKYSSELVLFLGADVRVGQDEVIVALVVDILVQRHHVDVVEDLRSSYSGTTLKWWTSSYSGTTLMWWRT